MGLRILSLSADQELALLRKRILQLAGYEIVSPRSEKEALDAISLKNRFDVLIVCYRMWTGSALRLMRIFRKSNPAGQVLIMVRIYGEVPDIEGDRYVVGTDGPDALLRVISEIGEPPLKRAVSK